MEENHPMKGTIIDIMDEQVMESRYMEPIKDVGGRIEQDPKKEPFEVIEPKLQPPKNEPLFI